MYDSGPSDEELDAIGLRREDVEDTSDFEVWPENWLPYRVFSDASTQWRMGPSGPTGLDYLVVKWVMELMRVKRPYEVLCSIQVLEASALKTMRSD